MLSLAEEISSLRHFFISCSHIYLVLSNHVDACTRHNALFSTTGNSNSQRFSVITHFAAPSLGQSIRDWPNSYFTN